MVFQILRMIKGSMFHPQWLSDRFHRNSQKALKKLRNATVLDIGSGNAGYREMIHPSNTVFAIDYPETNARYRLNPDAFADARCLPVQSVTADVALLFEVLEHIDAPERVLGEISRVLRPGGELYISVPFIYPIHDAPNDYWRFTRYGIERLLYRHGFTVEKVTTHGNTICVALQMVNLALLEACRSLYRKNSVAGLVFGGLVYPVLLSMNFLALPFVHLPLGRAGNFGYFIQARRNDAMQSLEGAFN